VTESGTTEAVLWEAAGAAPAPLDSCLPGWQRLCVCLMRGGEHINA